MRDERYRIWPEILRRIGKREVSSADVADMLDYPSTEQGGKRAHWTACQLLRRLKNWGYIRRSGFADPEGGGVGRRRALYEITQKGLRKISGEKP